MGDARALGDLAQAERRQPWALGAILWELVVGRSPFPQPTSDEVLAEVRAARVPALTDLAPDAPPELASIVARAMSADPGQRYPDAAGFAADLGRYLDGQLVAAHEYGALALLVRFVRAWRIPLAVAGLGLVAIAAVLAVEARRVGRERDRSEANLAFALVAAAHDALGSDARAQAEVLAAHAMARVPLAEARGVLVSLPEVRPRRESLGALGCQPVDLAGTRVLCRSHDTIAVLDGATPRWRHTVTANHWAAFFDEGRSVVVTVDTGYRLLDAATGATMAEVNIQPCARPGPSLGGALSAAFTGKRFQLIGGPARSASVEQFVVCGDDGLAAVGVDPAGLRVAAVCRGGDYYVGSPAGFRSGELRRQVVPAAIDAAEIAVVAFAGQSDTLLVGTNQGAVWRLEPDGRLAALPGRDGHGRVVSLAVSPDARYLVIRRDADPPMVLDLALPAVLGRVAGRGAAVAAFAADLRLVVAGAELSTWDFAGVRPRALEFAEGIAAIAFSPDGARVAIAHGAEVAVVDRARRAVETELRWQDDLVKSVAFSATGEALAVHGFGTFDVRRFALAPGFAALPAARVHARWRRIVPLADGSFLAAGYSLGVSALVPGAEARPLAAPPMIDLAASLDGRWIVGLDQRRWLWRGSELQAGGDLTPCGQVAEAVAVAIAPDGLVAAAAGDAVEARCGPLGTAQRYRAPGADLRAVVVGPTWIAAGASDGSVWVWRRGGPDAFLIVRDHRVRVEALALDPAERWLVAGGWDGHVAFIDLARSTSPSPAAVERAWGLDLRAAFDR